MIEYQGGGVSRAPLGQAPWFSMVNGTEPSHFLLQLTYLPQPWGSCRASIKGEQTLPGYESYSIAACRLQCEKEAVVRNCQCRMVHMPGKATLPTSKPHGLQCPRPHCLMYMLEKRSLSQKNHLFCRSPWSRWHSLPSHCLEATLLDWMHLLSADI